MIDLSRRGVRIVLLDIEGTTTPIAFVHEVLFSYARARLGPEWHALMDRDAKDPELKRVQGLVWEQGYQAGELRGEVFPDVPAAMRRWHAQGVRIAIYSSGSELAQRRLFETTTHGDLTGLIDAYFDTGVGPKRSADSYAAIAARLQTHPQKVLFISDVTAELEAARAAGMQVLLSERPGNAPVAAGSFESVTTFDDIS